MNYIPTNLKINVEWTVKKGIGNEAEDFSRSIVALFLFSGENRWTIPCEAGYTGVVTAQLPETLPDGVYSFDLIWYKNDGSLNSTRCVQRTRKACVFAIDAAVSHPDNWDGQPVTLKMNTVAAPYGYDGLSAYEIAVLRGATTLDEYEWSKGLFNDVLANELAQNQEEIKEAQEDISKAQEDIESGKKEVKSIRKTVENLAASGGSGGGGASIASAVVFDNTNTGFAAANVQDAIDEAAARTFELNGEVDLLDRKTQLAFEEVGRTLEDGEKTFQEFQKILQPAVTGVDISDETVSADCVSIEIKTVDNPDGAWLGFPVATQEKAGVITASDKQRLDEAITSEDTDKVVESIEEGIVHNALRKTKQILTEEEKKQARENIGAVSEQTFEDEAVRVKKQIFTSEQKYQARHNISAITAEEAEKIAQDKINETSVSSPDKLQAVKELSSWLESNPDSAATMNADIQENAADIQRLYRGTGIDEYSQFSTGMDYSAGDIVLYDGVLFRFKADHAKGEWDYNEVEEWSEKKEREEKLTELSSDVGIYNIAPSSDGENKDRFIECNLVRGIYTFTLSELSASTSVVLNPETDNIIVINGASAYTETTVSITNVVTRIKVITRSSTKPVLKIRKEWLYNSNSIAIVESQSLETLPNIDTAENTLTFKSNSRVFYGSNVYKLNSDVVLNIGDVGSTVYRVVINKDTNEITAIPYTQTLDEFRYATIAVGKSDARTLSIIGDYSVDGSNVRQSITSINNLIDNFGYCYYSTDDNGKIPNFTTGNSTAKLTFYGGVFSYRKGYISIKNISGYNSETGELNISLKTDVIGSPLFAVAYRIDNNQIYVFNLTDLASVTNKNKYILICTGRNANNSVYALGCTFQYTLNSNLDTNEMAERAFGLGYNINELRYDNEDMVWSWWNYPQAVSASSIRKNLYFGYCDSQKHTGVCQYNQERNAYKKNHLKMAGLVDDHNASAVFLMSDGKIMHVSDGNHGYTNNLNVRISDGAENIEKFGDNISVNVGGGCAYSQILYSGGKYWIFTRVNLTKWVGVYSSDRGQTWSSPLDIITSDVQYYCLFRPIKNSDNLIRIAMYSNPDYQDTNIRLGYLNTETNEIYNSDYTTVLGSAGEGVNKDLFDIIVPQTSTSTPNRLFDLSITELTDVRISYCHILDLSTNANAEYMVYINGQSLNVCSSYKSIQSTYYGGCSFINKERLVISRYDEGYDIIETRNILDGTFVLDRELSRTEVVNNIRECRPIADINQKYIVTQKGYYNPVGYTEFQMDANIYII